MTKKKQIAKEIEKAEAAAAQDARTKRISGLADKLEQFYEAWGVVRQEEELHVLADKYLNSPDDLDVKLRERYDGTDLSTPISEIAQARSKREEDQSRPEQHKSHIETTREQARGASPCAAKSTTAPRANVEAKKKADQLAAAEEERRRAERSDQGPHQVHLAFRPACRIVLLDIYRRAPQQAKFRAGTLTVLHITHAGHVVWPAGGI